MRVWVDALTPKQGRLAAYIARELSARGFSVVATARSYDYTVAAMRRAGVEPLVIGVHGGGSLRGKLEADIARMRLLLDAVGEDFDALVAFVNPSAARIAFGLGRPYIAMTDSPHSEAASRLSLPLATHIVYPACIPRREIKAYVHPRTRLMPYAGVDEVLWLRSFTPSRAVLDELGLEEERYVVVRPPEIRASYHPGASMETWAGVLKGLSSRGFTIVYMPRYGAEDPLLPRIQALTHGRVVVPSYDRGVDGPSLEFFAAAVISGGATMAREAALLGTPGITLYPGELYVNTFVSSLGLPLHSASSAEEVLRIVDRYRGVDRGVLRGKAFRVVRGLESPMEQVLRALEELRR